ncbi:unnamed protein product [Spirodela intermedia]|uniref:Uncharacterized protein n=1 Tax=Spirodela intermedia TaxID=51605 RepID=A0A7I8JX11_SPIIN|nr:unnamed protein product [Spirodela intermedia]
MVSYFSWRPLKRWKTPGFKI